MSYVPPQWNRIVYCPFCNWMVTIKPTKTNKLMLRCNNCTLNICKCKAVTTKVTDVTKLSVFSFFVLEEANAVSS